MSININEVQLLSQTININGQPQHALTVIPRDLTSQQSHLHDVMTAQLDFLVVQNTADNTLVFRQRLHTTAELLTFAHTLCKHDP